MANTSRLRTYPGVCRSFFWVRDMKPADESELLKDEWKVPVMWLYSEATSISYTNFMLVDISLIHASYMEHLTRLCRITFLDAQIVLLYRLISRRSLFFSRLHFDNWCYKQKYYLSGLIAKAHTQLIMRIFRIGVSLESFVLMLTTFVIGLEKEFISLIQL